MSLRCSLLGHEYGENEIERDREERGDEVVISVTELERCKRCGNARVISENTEVTQRSPRSAPRPNVNADPDAGTPESTPQQETDDPLDEARSTATDRSLDAGPSSGSASDLDPDPGVDDAEILDAEASGDDSSREPDAWPEHDEAAVDEGSSGTTEWPSVEGEDEGFDASVPDGEPTDVEFGGGLTPRSVDQGAEILEGVTSASHGEREGDADAEFVRAGASPAPDRSADVEGETEIYCPNCDTADLDERDSLRAGDICPACRRGYLAERER